MLSRLFLCLVTCAQSAPSASQALLDDFEDIASWQVIASDGVQASLAQDAGVEGQALRLDFDFQSGSGFCVVRRAVDFALPANYRFSFSIRGQAPSNDLEFKLVDPTGENVWWVKKYDVSFPSEWQRIRYKARHFRFAWGPSGGKPLDKVGYIEFAVAAGSGGKGSVFIDSLSFEALPEYKPPTEPPAVSVSSVSDQRPSVNKALGAAGEVNWTSAAGDASPWLELDFHQTLELGGMVVAWGQEDFATDYDVLLNEDETGWTRVVAIRESNGGDDYVRLPDAEGRRLRLEVTGTSRGQGVAIDGLRIQPLEFGESDNALLRTMAGESRRGLFPRYGRNEQTPWTVVGVAGDAKEALVSENGAVEVDKGAFTLEPFLWTDGRLVTWADARVTQRLAGDFAPIPTVTWQTDSLSLETTALADGPAGASVLLVRYRLRNISPDPQTGLLSVAVRPFQVLPPWQDLNIAGGISTIESISYDGKRVLVNNRKAVESWTQPSRFGTSSFMQGDVVEYLSKGRVPPWQSVSDPAGLASAAMAYAFALAPGETKNVVLAVPFHKASADPRPDSGQMTEAFFESRLQAVTRTWEKVVSRVGLRLPPSAAEFVNTFKSTQAYILVNMDGPAIQPGSRSYERSWIRDGALTSTALLATGHPELVKAYLDWYAAYQYPSGKVPCVVDVRGPDPVDEHDSTGQLIYALLTYYRFTGDREFLAKHLDAVVAGVNYLESLRNQRLTPEYRDGPPEKRACFGLVPESISHEGYCAKPMHSYWDSFFVVRGLEDATTIAGILNRPDLEKRFGALRDAYRKSMYDSMRLAMKTKGVDYIPGCAELGDFDATSTAIGVFPCGELGRIPEPQLNNTFEKYYDFFKKRRDGDLEWEAYTPYEVRLVGTFVRLGQPGRAHELLDFFFDDQRPADFQHWAEVVWCNPNTPKYIGDMPHTWVGSDFLNAARSLFVYEREKDEALVLMAGGCREWLEAPEGVAIERFPTQYGQVSYSAAYRNDRLAFDLSGISKLPSGGISLISPIARPIRAVSCDGKCHPEFTECEVRLQTPTTQVIVEY